MRQWPLICGICWAGHIKAYVLLPMFFLAEQFVQQIGVGSSAIVLVTLGVGVWQPCPETSCGVGVVCRAGLELGRPPYLAEVFVIAMVKFIRLERR